MLYVRIQAKPYNISLIQCYAPTVAASDEEKEDFYNMLLESIDISQNRDITIVMGDFNANIGNLTTILISVVYVVWETRTREVKIF